jgi:hypothetical protein
MVVILTGGVDLVAGLGDRAIDEGVGVGLLLAAGTPGEGEPAGGGETLQLPKLRIIRLITPKVRDVRIAFITQE